LNYYTSDLHIGHENILIFDKRPFKDLREMHDTLVEKWNKKVSKADHVYILGDFAFSTKAFIKYCSLLNGTLHIVPGNHDPKNIKKHNIPGVIFHDLIHYIKDEGRPVVLSHYPIREWNGFYHKRLHFHGHTHGSIGMSFQPNAFEVGTMCHNFEPVSYDEILNGKEIHDYKVRNYSHGET
jgi:calcineurin-like phosphoesterase family protein